MASTFEDFQPIFGQAKAEWDPPPPPVPLHPFLFHLSVTNPSRLRILVSDFQTHTFEGIRSIQDLEDLRDRIGVGGSWSEFVDYLIASISSPNVKLVLGGIPKSTGLINAKLVAHKSKGMPLISISLNRLTDSSAGDSMAILSIELFKAYKNKRDEVVREQERLYLLTKRLAAEQEKNESLEHQLVAVKFSSKATQKLDKGFPVADAFSDMDTVSGSDTQQSDIGYLGFNNVNFLYACDSFAEKRSSENLDSLKLGKRVVPAYRRVKVRGAMLQDSDDKN